MQCSRKSSDMSDISDGLAPKAWWEISQTWLEYKAQPTNVWWTESFSSTLQMTLQPILQDFSHTLLNAIPSQHHFSLCRPFTPQLGSPPRQSGTLMNSSTSLIHWWYILMPYAAFARSEMQHYTSWNHYLASINTNFIGNWILLTSVTLPATCYPANMLT